MSLDVARQFGRHVRSLRKVRAFTQEELAERSGLSTDTIRRLEHGSFSPSLDTLRKLTNGLTIALSTLFRSFEFGERDPRQELLDMVCMRSTAEIEVAMRVLRALFDELDQLAREDDDDEDEREVDEPEES